MTSLETELLAAVRAPSAQATTLALCRAWALVPSTRIAKLARGFARQLHRASVPGANEAQREAAWHELAARAHPEDLDSLLATPWSKRPKLAAARLAELKRLGPDPRTVGHLLELDTGSRFASTVGRQFWLEAYALLFEWGSVEAAERIPRTPTAGAAQSLTEGVRHRMLYEPLLARFGDRWPQEPSLEPACTALVEELERRLEPSTVTTRELLAAVYAAPHDDGPRLVFADALTEQGDPRGEFIALQFAHARGELTMARREQMQRLLSASGRAWFDGLDTQVEPLAVFHRGFLNEVVLATRAPDPSLPAWSTVEVLNTGGLATALSAFLSEPHLRGVHGLVSVRGETLAELARSGPERRFSLLEVSSLAGRELARPKWTVETLRFLPLADQVTWWLGGGALAGLVEHLSLALRTGFERVGALVGQLEELDPAVRTLELSARPPWWPKLWHGDWLMRFERNKRGRFATLSLSLAEEQLSGLEDALASLGNDQLEALEVSVILGRGPTWRQSARELIERATRPQRRLERREFKLEKPVKLPPRRIVTNGT